MRDDEVYELAIDDGIARDDYHAIVDFMLGFRLAEGDQPNASPD